jgi:hypothetical protein
MKNKCRSTSPVRVARGHLPFVTSPEPIDVVGGGASDVVRRSVAGIALDAGDIEVTVLVRAVWVAARGDLDRNAESDHAAVCDGCVGVCRGARTTALVAGSHRPRP